MRECGCWVGTVTTIRSKWCGSLLVPAFRAHDTSLADRRCCFRWFLASGSCKRCLTHVKCTGGEIAGDGKWPYFSFKSDVALGLSHSRPDTSGACSAFTFAALRKRSWRSWFEAGTEDGQLAEPAATLFCGHAAAREACNPAQNMLRRRRVCCSVASMPRACWRRCCVMLSSLSTRVAITAPASRG